MSEQQETENLKRLEIQLQAALELRRKGEIDKAAEALKGILKSEPRLAEPRLELASILLHAGQLEEAEGHAEEAISILESGGQWTDEIPENVLLSMAWSLLGESVRRQAESDAVVFGDPEEWKNLMERTKEAFKKAETLDTDNTHASEWAFGLQLAGEEV